MKASKMRARHIVQQMLKTNKGIIWYNTEETGFSSSDMKEILMKIDLQKGRMYNTMYITDNVSLMTEALPEHNNLSLIHI